MAPSRVTVFFFNLASLKTSALAHAAMKPFYDSVFGASPELLQDAPPPLRIARTEPSHLS